MARILPMLLLAVCLPAAGAGLDDVEIIKRTLERMDRAQVSPAKERRIGEGMAARLLGTTPPVDDERVQRYVNRVGLWVAAGSDQPDLDWTFAVVDSAGVNAWAAPGGYVFITVGLFVLLEDEAELAAVLGHEIAHVTAGHHLEALASRVRTGMIRDLLQAEDIAGVDDATVDSLAAEGARLFGLGLSREAEHEADRLGAVLAARAGYDPWALLGTLTVLDALDPAAPAMSLHASTHPPPQVRRALLARQLDATLDTGGDPGARPVQRFRAMRDRLADGP
ncbi:MAG: M48 family metalloprotease [Halofilum sp. (in: g-proteobacteria)]|nr:M48 family metalloprotease [Halofilum sp. (in: g-proteobacteria)]